MNNTGKTITAITTAAAIGTGVLLTTTQEPAPVEQEQPAQVEFVDDIKPIEVPIVTVPTITVDSLVTRINAISPPVAAVSVATQQTPPLSPPVATCPAGSVQLPAASPPAVAQVSIAPVSVISAAADIARIQDLHRAWAAILKDKRQLNSDKGISIHNAAMEKWLAIYQQPLPPPLEPLPLPKGIRMIAELRSLDHAAENLAYYRQQGYNACLVPVYGDERPMEIIARLQCVRQAKMKPWIAWAGPESLAWTIYRDPDHIARLLALAAPLCEGYLCAWRRTSAHLVMQDAPYLEHLAAAVRQANPAIYIVGESYYGETWENEPHSQRHWTARDNAPRNPSGVLIAGMATQNFPIEIMLQDTFARWLDSPRLAMVLGERPYYASRNDNGRSFLVNLRIKQQLERRFLRAACHGTITIHGDGSDSGTSLQAADDLGRYKID